MAPGLILMSALGYQIYSIITRPTLANVLLRSWQRSLFWIGLTIGIQWLLIRSRRFQGLSSRPSATVRAMRWNIHGAVGTDGRFAIDPHHSRNYPP